MVDRVVLGTAQLGMQYGISNRSGQPSIDRCYEIIEAAWNKNIKYFDTAQSYGTAESILGRIFNELRIADKVSVISKVPYEINIADETEILKSIDKSIKTLHIEGLYGLLLHNPRNIDSWNKRGARILRAIRKNGMAKKVGVSVYSYKDALKVLSLEDFEIVQMPFNIFDQFYYSQGIYKEARKYNKSVFIRSIFLQGLLLMELDELSEKQKDFAKYLQKRDSVCTRFGLTKKELAVGYIKKRLGDAYIVFGAEEPFQVDETVQLLNKVNIDNAVVNAIEEELFISDEDIINPSKWNR